MADDYPADEQGMSAKAVIEKALYEWAITVAEMESDAVINRHSNTPHIADLVSKQKDPSAGFWFAMIAEGIYLLDKYVLPLGNIHKQLLSIYHVANMFVYPLSYFINEAVSGITPTEAITQFYAQWAAFYPNFQQVNFHTGKARNYAFAKTLPEQTALLKPAYAKLYAGIADLSDTLTKALHPKPETFFTKVGHFFEILFGGKMASTEAAAKATFDHYLQRYANTPMVNTLLQNHEQFTTLVLTVLLTEGAVPKAAMGWSLSDDMQNPTRENLSALFPAKMLDKVHAVPQGALLADHSAMMIPSKALFEKIYVDQLMAGLPQSFGKFGRYPVGEKK